MFYFPINKVVFIADRLVIEIPRPEAADFAVGHGASKSEASSKLWSFL